MPLNRSEALRVISKPELNHQNPTMTSALAANTTYATSGVDQTERAGGRRRKGAVSVEVASWLTLEPARLACVHWKSIGGRGSRSPIRLQSIIPNIEAGRTDWQRSTTGTWSPQDPESRFSASGGSFRSTSCWVFCSYRRSP